MKLTEHEYRTYCRDYDGYCPKCDEVTVWGGVEPDAEGRHCEQCESITVVGIEQAMIMGLIDVQEDE